MDSGQRRVWPGIMGLRGGKGVWCLALWLVIGAAFPVQAKVFQFSNLTDRPGGPGHGDSPWINAAGDVAFYADNLIYYYDSSADTFLNLMSLAGAPDQGWFPRLSDAGDIAFIDPGTLHVWFFDAATRGFTDLATLPGFPGVSGEHGLYWVFDMNQHRQFALHAGPLNLGDVYFFDLADSSFTRLTGQSGAPFRGKECQINDLGVVAYNGYPDIYEYDPSTGQTRNITDLPGGPGTGLPGFMLNNRSDIAISKGEDLVYFNAADETFWYLATLPGYPASQGTVDRNCLADDGAISFWADEIYYFDPADSSFTQLTSQGPVPYAGHDSRINPSGTIVFSAGADIWLADPVPVSAVPGGNESADLLRNDPNPFNPSTQIRFAVPVGGAQVRLAVFDLAGHRVRILMDEFRAEGSCRRHWDGRDDTGTEVASGIYFALLEAGGTTVCRKMQLIR